MSILSGEISIDDNGDFTIDADRCAARKNPPVYGDRHVVKVVSGTGEITTQVVYPVGDGGLSNSPFTIRGF